MRRFWGRLRAEQSFLALAAIAVLFRLPPLVNASDVITSDAAIVGLQAMHVLRGELALYLWGAGYQSSAETFLLAPAIAIFGAHPIVLVCFSIASHLAIMWLTYAMLAKAASRRIAFFLVLTIAWTTWAALTPSVAPPRGWALAVYFFAVHLIDGARVSNRSEARASLGIALLFVAAYLDLFVLQLLPTALAFALLTSRDFRRGAGRHAAFVVASAALSCVGFAWIRSMAEKLPDSLVDLSAAHVASTFPHFWNESLPATIGLKAYAQSDGITPPIWTPPTWFMPVTWLGASVLAVSYASPALLFFSREIPWRARRLGMFGLLGAATSVIGFLSSGRIVDMWSMRYLSPITLMLPFALAPLAVKMRATKSAIFLAPYLVSTLVAGWMAYGHWVNGIRVVATPRGVADDEQRLGAELRKRDVHVAEGNYWLSYRLTFLWKEDPIVVPFADDRFAPYRRAFEAASRFAYVFHPNEPRAKAEDYARTLRDEHASFDEETIAGFEVIVVDRTPKK